MHSKPNSTLLFHITDEEREVFSSRSSKRPTFYWFNDSYHSHLLGPKPAYKFMYFFIVKPSSDVKLFTRHGKGDFESLWNDFAEYLDDRNEHISQGNNSYLEPGIVMSFSRLTPVLKGEFSDDFTLTLLNTGTSFNLKDNNRFRLFGEIPELINACPDLEQAVPIIMPTLEEVKKPASFWPADTENMGRMWL
jgi:hypothetical protein